MCCVYVHDELKKGGKLVVGGVENNKERKREETMIFRLSV